MTYGPYDTERDTYDEPMPTAVRDFRGSRDMVLEHLVDACGETGVVLGAYDRRILDWLAGWEPATVQVVIGLITRAHDGGWRAAVGEDGG